MKHKDCINYIHLDCEKGMCAITKEEVPMGGEGSEACKNYMAAPTCGNCHHFCNKSEHGIGICRGFARESWAYETCGAFTCGQYQG